MQCERPGAVAAGVKRLSTPDYVPCDNAAVVKVRLYDIDATLDLWLCAGCAEEAAGQYPDNIKLLEAA